MSVAAKRSLEYTPSSFIQPYQRRPRIPALLDGRRDSSVRRCSEALYARPPLDPHRRQWSGHDRDGNTFVQSAVPLVSVTQCCAALPLPSCYWAAEDTGHNHVKNVYSCLTPFSSVSGLHLLGRRRRRRLPAGVQPAHPWRPRLHTPRLRNLRRRSGTHLWNIRIYIWRFKNYLWRLWNWHHLRRFGLHLWRLRPDTRWRGARRQLRRRTGASR